MDFPVNCMFVILPVDVHSCWIYVHILLNLIHSLEGPLSFYDPVPQNANLNENRKIKSLPSVTAALSEYLLYLTFKPRIFLVIANVLALLNVEGVK